MDEAGGFPIGALAARTAIYRPNALSSDASWMRWLPHPPAGVIDMGEFLLDHQQYNTYSL